jgi:hypothetical protein
MTHCAERSCSGMAGDVRTAEPEPTSRFIISGLDRKWDLTEKTTSLHSAEIVTLQNITDSTTVAASNPVKSPKSSRTPSWIDSARRTSMRKNSTFPGGRRAASEFEDHRLL